MTAVLVGVLLAAAIFANDIAVSLFVLSMLVVCRIYSVRGYSVKDGRLFVHRFGWAKRFDLATLSEAAYEPGAMQGSVRTWGIGGVFGFIGHFRNGVLGPYRAYATDPARTVVLKFGGKTVVVTPEHPAEFVAAVQAG